MSGIKKRKRIVVKIGTNTLTRKDGSLNPERIGVIVKDIVNTFKMGYEVILVTSGAIACGVSRLKLKKRPSELPEKQATAAIGQPLLMKVYEEHFSEYKIPVAQLLLTKEDFENRKRYINARNTIFTLLKLGVIPVINENDTISTEEIKFGDNDTLSAMVAIKAEADILIILTDVDGLYTDDPNKNKNAVVIHEVKRITHEIESCAKCSPGSGFSTGGMFTKIKAAKIAAKSGVETVIANGFKSNILQDILSGAKIGTRFQKEEKTIDSKKRWIAFGAKVKGKIRIDSGAKDALIKNSKSLLASGIIAVEGKFDAGDSVAIYSTDGKELARGIVQFSKVEIEKIKGKKSSEISKILDKSDFLEVIHRDNLVLM
ncbi:MAG: glutamate 5-kinase [Elusimicrobia bacterium RIFOXYA2_FULL_39_19]|nr:MAG: glutamate 5-kinase [Elusimicrobia bacterium RIFOXYA2_FULL_39_19]